MGLGSATMETMARQPAGGSMTLPAEKRCIREQIAIDVNAGNLAPGEEAGPTRTVDRIGALGMAGSRSLAKRLSAALWRLRARDHRARGEAASLFAAYLAKKREVTERWHVFGPSPMLSRLAAIVVVEWEHERCGGCGGDGGQPVAIGRNTGMRTFCPECRGTGRRPLEHGDRAQLLGVSFSVYEKHWQRRFEQASGWLRDIEPAIDGGLRKLLSRRIVPIQHE